MAAAVAAAAVMLHTARTQAPDAYGVGAAMERFEAARGALPQRGTVAYLTDLPESTGAIPYLAAGYALAPLLAVPVEKAPAVGWAVGNFSRPLDYAAAGAPYGFTVVTDFGNGVILYRKALR